MLRTFVCALLVLSMGCRRRTAARARAAAEVVGRVAPAPAAAVSDASLTVDERLCRRAGEVYRQMAAMEPTRLAQELRALERDMRDPRMAELHPVRLDTLVIGSDLENGVTRIRGTIVTTHDRLDVYYPGDGPQPGTLARIYGLRVDHETVCAMWVTSP